MNDLRSLFGAAVVCLVAVSAALAGPKEDAFAVVEEFKKGFDASDPPAVTKLFAKDAIFLGTVMQGPTKERDVISKYFTDALSVDRPRRVEIENYLTVQLSEAAFIFSGQNKFVRTKDGKEIEGPARFTFVVTKGADGWAISHFHSSSRPRPPQ